MEVTMEQIKAEKECIEKENIGKDSEVTIPSPVRYFKKFLFF